LSFLANYAQEALVKKSRFTESQIVGILKEADAGLRVSELCSKRGISDATYYNWKAKYGGMSASELKRMKDLEAELPQLKRMYADLALENRAKKDLIEKSSLAAREARGGRFHERRALPWGALPAVQCHRRLQSRVAGDRNRHFVESRSGSLRSELINK
jgi:putative transposase